MRKIARASIAEGDTFDVTNHYIDRVDHPCYGTHRRVVVRNNAGGITFDIGGRCSWNSIKELRLEDDGSITMWGFPTDGDLFLTLVPA